jgi:septum formation protein
LKPTTATARPPVLTGALAERAVVLATASEARYDILCHAGVPIERDPPHIDESEVKSALRGEGATAAQAAETLAELKARHVARRHPGALVIGADQILECAGTWFDKPADRNEAAAHLKALSGRGHELHAAVCVLRGETRLWHHNAMARLRMRQLGEDFIGAYLDAAGDSVLGSVGGYRLEGLGAQLFDRVEGDYFTVLGLPLLPLLDFLRAQGALRS